MEVYEHSGHTRRRANILPTSLRRNRSESIILRRCDVALQRIEIELVDGHNVLQVRVEIEDSRPRVLQLIDSWIEQHSGKIVGKAWNWEGLLLDWRDNKIVGSYCLQLVRF